MNTAKFFLLVLYACLAAPAVIYGQTEPVRNGELDRGRWADLTEGLDYPVPQYEEEAEVSHSPSGPSKGWVIFFKVLAVVMAIGIIAFIIAQLQSGESLFGAKNRKLEKELQINLKNIEENLPEADIPDFIRHALREGDFRMAVRLHYLGVIQLLAGRGWIKWERDKTNGDYLREVDTGFVFDGFREATLIFERVWYGNRSLEEGYYRHIAARFAELEQRIQKR